MPGDFEIELRYDSIIRPTEIRFFNGDFLKAEPVLADLKYDLVIADPPYFKVVNEAWDYQWSTLDEYLAWCDQWLKVCAAKMRFGGSLFLFGYFRNLAPLVAVAEAHGLELRQQIVIDKGIKAVAGRKTSTYRIFPNVTESMLFFIKDNKKIIKPLLKDRATELGLSSKEINERLGVKSNGGGMWSIYTGKNVCEQFPTRATWDKLMKVLDLDLDYNKYAQTFNTTMGLTDVWTDIEFYTKDRIHPTEKPNKLIRRLIDASTNEGDFILDPFGGSAISAIVASETGRHADVFELSEEYFSESSKRLTQKGIVFSPIILAPND